MKYYHCKTCNEQHAILEDSDIAERIVECDNHGHVKNCVTEPSKREPWHWCAYCARKITEAEYNEARAKS